MDKYQNLLNLGTLMFGIVNETTSNTSCFLSLGEIDYLQNNWLINTAGVQEFPNFPSGSGRTNFLNDIELELIRTNSFAIILISNSDNDLSITSYTMDIQAATQVSLWLNTVRRTKRVHVTREI